MYVRSGAGGTADGSTWANAFLTLAAALTAKAAGDDFWVSEDHAETQASAMTLTSPGTAASPCRILCVNHAGTVPPVSADLRTTATISTTVGSAMSFAGFAYFYGITFNAGSGNNTASINFKSSSAWWFRLEACALALVSTGASSKINFGNNGANNGALIELINTTLSFGSTSQGVLTYCPVRWSNTASAILGTVPTTLFTNFAGDPCSGNVQCIGVDFSALGSGKNLVNESAGFNVYSFQDCKLGASVTLTTGSVSNQGAIVVTIVNTDSADTKYRYSKQTYQGTITHEVTNVRSGGASDGTTTIARKMVSTANSQFYSPLETDPIPYWNESTSAITITVNTLTDNVTLKNTDCWIEVEYQGTTSFPQGKYTTSGVADVLASGTNNTTDSGSTWTTSGIGTPVKQSMAVTFTPTGKGLIRVKVMLAKASTTVWFDPLVVASSGRQYQIFGSYINEADDPATTNVKSGIAYNQSDSTGSYAAGGAILSRVFVGF